MINKCNLMTMKIIKVVLLLLLLTNPCVAGSKPVSMIDSLKIVLSNATETRKKGGLSMRIGRSYEASNTDSGLFYLEKSLSFYNELADTSYIGWAHHLIGGMYFMRGQDSLALSHSLTANSLLTQKKDTIEYILARSYLGTIYETLGYPRTALKYLFEADSYCGNNNLDKHFAYGDLQIGNILCKLGNIKKAKNYYRKSLKSSTHSREITMAIIGLASCELKLGKADECDSLLREAFLVREEGPYFLAILYSLKSELNTFEKQYELAISNLDSAQFFYDKMSANTECLECLLTQGELNLKIDNLEKANLVIARIDSANDNISSIELDQKISILKSKYFESISNADSSLFYMRAYVLATDSIYKKRKDATAADVEAKYDLSKKDFELKEQSQMLINSAKELEYESRLKIVIIIAFLFILIAGYLLYSSFKKKEKDKVDFELLNLKHKALQLQMNPHFIFNVLNTIYSSVRKGDENRIKKMILDFSILIRNVLSSSREEKVLLEDEIKSLTAYLDLNKALMNNQYTYEFDLINIDADNTMISPMLLQPLLENAIEHGIFPMEEEGEIKIKIEKTGAYIYYTIMNNGVDFDFSKKSKESIALNIIKERIKGLNSGQEKYFKVEKNMPKGTKVSFRVPFEEYWD